MRQSQAEQEDAGEGYFASISDLMVGILFVFLLMLAVFAINYAADDPEDKNKRIRDLENEVAGLKSERDTLRNRLIDREIELAVLRGEMSELLAEQSRLRDGLANLIAQLESVSEGLKDDQGRLERIRGDLLVNIQSELEKRKVKVEVVTAQGILRLSSEGLFELGEAKFTRPGLANAKALIDQMGQLLPCFSNTESSTMTCRKQPIFETVLIEGHTDTQPAKMEGGNWKLSTDRARAFLNLMTDESSGLGNLRNDSGQLLLGLAGYGESRPLRDIDEADERNRRIEIRFLLSSNRESLTDRIRRLESLLLTLRNLAASRQ
jgi:chemotaxis protein MotB